MGTLKESEEHFFHYKEPFVQRKGFMDVKSSS